MVENYPNRGLKLLSQDQARRHKMGMVPNIASVSGDGAGPQNEETFLSS
ncbi:MAG: hypothetical protein IPG79_14265 [Saprospiraceae bacterium]|nr:hypothetical protein [Saprospiraceae bacterium]